MVEIYETTRVGKVPLATVIDKKSVVFTPTVGLKTGDHWVHVHPGSKIKMADWPNDRVAVSPERNKPPQKHSGAGAAARERLVAKGFLVPEGTEAPPDPTIQRTHPETGVFDENGKVRTMEVRAIEGESPQDAPVKAAKRRGKG